MRAAFARFSNSGVHLGCNKVTGDVERILYI